MRDPSGHWTDVDHLRWVADRLTKVHGDREGDDFVHRLREIAERLENPPKTAFVRAFEGYTERQVSLAMDFLEAIATERRRAHEKHGATSMEQSPPLHHRRASILAEEAVECGKALNDHEHGDIKLWTHEDSPYPDDWGYRIPCIDPLDKELIQTGAMAYTWWANRRGDRLAPVPKPARGESYEAVELLRQILRETHLMVPTRRKVEALLAGVDEPVREWTFTKAKVPPGLTFNEVSFVTDEPDPSKGVYPLLHVGQPGEVLVRALEVGTKGQSVRCVMVSGGGIHLCELPYDVVPGQTFTVKDPRPVSPPADDPDGGRRGD